MTLTFSIRCLLCDNSDDNDWYFVPQEIEVMDGKVRSLTKYDLVCKKCNMKHLLELNFQKGVDNG
jgi:hypothetical protein